MSKCCCGNEGVTLLYPCSGGADVGALSDRIARKLAKEGYGKMSCLAGIGSDISGFIESAKCADLNITIDGCSLRCAAKNFENRGITSASIVLTELGFQKGKTEINDEVVDSALEKIAKQLDAKNLDDSLDKAEGCCCG
jgi:uncharacterized metal-binding protein